MEADFFGNLRRGISSLKPSGAGKSATGGLVAMAEIDGTTVLSMSDNASFQSLGEGAVVLLIDSGQLYTCNETTEAFLKLVDGTRRFEAIIDALLTEFDVEPGAAMCDFMEIAEQLMAEGIIEIKKGP
jgi:pyrroloquinoline quinone biosynthesis protein D